MSSCRVLVQKVHSSDHTRARDRDRTACHVLLCVVLFLEFLDKKNLLFHTRVQLREPAGMHTIQIWQPRARGVELPQGASGSPGKRIRSKILTSARWVDLRSKCPNLSHR